MNECPVDPVAIVVCGAAGVGKSTFAGELARRLRAALVDIDPCTSDLVSVGLGIAGMPLCDRDSPRYKVLFRVPIHQQLFRIAKQQLHTARCSVVVVAPFTAERRRDDFAAFLDRELDLDGGRVPLHIFYLYCRGSERMRRIAQRGLQRDVMKLSDGSLHAYHSESEDDKEPFFAAQLCSRATYPRSRGVVRATALDVTSCPVDAAVKFGVERVHRGGQPPWVMLSSAAVEGQQHSHL